MQTKAPPPHSLLTGQKVSPYVEAFFEFAHLKQLYRQGWLKRGLPPEQCESVAEHTLGVAILALWLVEAVFPELDLTKILCMALLHDFGEVYTGDLIPSDAVSADEKHARERQSIGQVLGKLPQGERYLELWEEFEQGETPEARFVRQIDRLEMGLQAGVYGLQGAVDPAEFLNTAQQALSEPNLKNILAEIKAVMAVGAKHPAHRG
jgi:putative hydrolases of HD superfamily